uniref:Uncharacterized protein n=1 Tax=Anopheles farauti TaxID=69004 RepID=A0A182QDM7_9DIPT
MWVLLTGGEKLLQLARHIVHLLRALVDLGRERLDVAVRARHNTTLRWWAGRVLLLLLLGLVLLVLVLVLVLGVLWWLLPRQDDRGQLLLLFLGDLVRRHHDVARQALLLRVERLHAEDDAVGAGRHEGGVVEQTAQPVRQPAVEQGGLDVRDELGLADELRERGRLLERLDVVDRDADEQVHEDDGDEEQKQHERDLGAQLEHERWVLAVRVVDEQLEIELAHHHHQHGDEPHERVLERRRRREDDAEADREPDQHARVGDEQLGELDLHLRVHRDVRTEDGQLADHHHEVRPAEQDGERADVVLPRVRPLGVDVRDDEHAHDDEPLGDVLHLRDVPPDRRVAGDAVQLPADLDERDRDQHQPLHLHHERVPAQHVAEDRLLLAQLLLLDRFLHVLAAVVAVVRERGQHVQREEEDEDEAEQQPGDVVLPDLAPLDVDEGGAERMLQHLLLALVDERVEVADLARVAVLQDGAKVELELDLLLRRVLRVDERHRVVHLLRDHRQRAGRFARDHVQRGRALLRFRRHVRIVEQQYLHAVRQPVQCGQMERREPEHVLLVHVRAPADERFDDVERRLGPPDRGVQWRPHVEVFLVRIGRARPQQQIHTVEAGCAGREMKRREAAVVFQPCLGALLEQQRHAGRISLVRRQMQRGRLLLPDPDANVRIRTGRTEQHAQTLHMAQVRRQVNRVHAARLDRVHVHTLGDEQPHAGERVRPNRTVQERLLAARPPRAQLQPCALPEQEQRRVGGIPERRTLQRRVRLRLQVHIDPLRHQDARAVQAVAERAQMERGEAARVVKRQLRPVLHQRVQQIPPLGERRPQEADNSATFAATMLPCSMLSSRWTRPDASRSWSISDVRIDSLDSSTPNSGLDSS